MKVPVAKPAAMLATRGLEVGYSLATGPLFRKLDLALYPGELTCFMGPNGIGKSTLIRTLAGLQPALGGSIQYRSASGAARPEDLALVLTDRITAVNMTVRELVTFGRYPYLPWGLNLTARDKHAIDQALAQVHIDDLQHKRLYELSDGQLQMVMIARAIAQDTPIILLDEPTAHLDLNNRLEIMNLLRTLATTLSKAILVATHELDLALQTADVIWLAGRNQQILHGIPEDLVLNGAFDEIFRFKGFDLKTGKVQHPVWRNETVQVAGESHAYLWTCNAFERHGYALVTDKATWHVTVGSTTGGVVWLLNGPDGQQTFNTLAGLLLHLQ